MPESAGEVVTWASLPNKGQLATVVFARFCEPFVRTSISTYVYYQLQSLDPSRPSDAIVREAALLQTVFTLAQGCTAVIWGTLADSPRGGRKLVLLLGLGGSMLSTLAFGFISNFEQAIAIRLIEGAVNGNTPVIRTMVSEIVKERRYQAKAFILMPMCYNIASIISPLIAGFLANLAGQYPETFGQIWFFRRFPYVPPAAVSASVSLVAWILVFFNLRETHPTAKHKLDPGLAMAARVRSLFARLFSAYKRKLSPSSTSQQQSYPGTVQNCADADEEAEVEEEGGDISETTRLLDSSAESDDVERPTSSAHSDSAPEAPMLIDTSKHPEQTLPFRRMFTRNLTLTLIAHGILEGHVSVYNTLWPSFLSDAVAPETPSSRPRLPFHFVGGLGLPARQIAVAFSFLGILGMPLQLGAYAPVVRRLGMVRAYRGFMRLFPLVYFLIPYLAVVPSSSPRPEPRSGPFVWAAIFGAQMLMIVSTTFVVPSQVVLTNNASPHPTALGRTHSTAEMINSFTRSVSPVVAGLLYTYGSARGVVGLPWWAMSGVTVLECLLSHYIREGDGHEIRLAGDGDD